MADNQFPFDVGGTDRIFAATPVGGAKEGMGVPTQSFTAFMKPQAAPMETAGKASLISPFGLTQQGQVPLAQSPTFDTLTHQINRSQSTVTDMTTLLHDNPDLKLKSAQKLVLRHKLEDANGYLRSANAKLGSQMPEEPSASSFHGPLGMFLRYLTGGQAQFEAAKQQLTQLKDKGESLSAGDFLLLQTKFSQASQLLEYSSVLLSNAVGGIKTLFGTQL